MIYILCSVLWSDNPSPPGYDISALYAAKTGYGINTDFKKFLSEEYENTACLIKAFLEFCGSEFMLGVWDGSSAGRIKKIFDLRGFRHPYIHLYQLCRVYELSMDKCRDIKMRRNMQTRLEKKPFYYGKRSSAETEVKWLASIFSLMDFSVMKKKPTVDFTEQPSNKYFVFRNGKCFHTKDCRIVRDAPVSALRSYTYYAAAVDAGFSPCMKCKPENLDKETAEIMRRINVKKQKEAREKYAAGQQPKKKRHRKKPDVFKSLSHMCALYGLKYEKSGKYVLITSDEGQYRIAPENESIELFRLENEDYVSLEKLFSDPYQAVREIVRLYECSKKQTADMGN